MLRDYGTGQRGAKQIFVFVDRSRLQCRPDIAGEKLFAQVFDDDFAGPRFVGFVDHGFDVISLAHVGDHGDDFAGIIFLKPGNDDGGIEASRIRENNLFF